MVTLFECFLVQTGAIKTGFLAQFDIPAQRFIRRCGPDTVGIKALIEYQPLVVRSIIQKNFIPLNMHFAQAGIRLHLIEHISGRIDQPVNYIVQERRLRSPEFRVAQRQHGYCIIRCYHVCFRNGFCTIPHFNLQFTARFTTETGTHNKLILVNVCHDLHRSQSLRINRFQPDGLPYSGSTRIIARP